MFFIAFFETVPFKLSHKGIFNLHASFLCKFYNLGMTQFAVLSVFHVEKSEEFQGNALRYIGPNDDSYYLRVYRHGRVNLRVSK